MKKKIYPIDFLWLLRQKEKQGFQVSESIAYACRNKGFVNKNFCQDRTKISIVGDMV